MTPEILRTGADVSEAMGNPIGASQMRAAASTIERLTGDLSRIGDGVMDPKMAASQALGNVPVRDVSACGNNLKSVREGAGLTLQELADRVGSSKAYMWQLENKTDPDPGIKLALKIADACAAPVVTLFA